MYASITGVAAIRNANTVKNVLRNVVPHITVAARPVRIVVVVLARVLLLPNDYWDD